MYQIGTCFLCQICLRCNSPLSFKHCQCDLSKKVKDTKKRKSYSRVYDSNTKHKVYNDLQLSELTEANKIYSYGIDFSQKFKYCLCSTCHNLMARLKKSQATKTLSTNSPKTSKSNIQVSRLTKSNSSSKNSREINNNDDDNDGDDDGDDDDDDDEIEEINKVEFENNLMDNKEEEDFQDVEQDKILGIEIEQDLELDVDDEVDNSEIEESEDEHVEISFKLVIRREGKNSAAKWETIYQTNFDNFMKDLYLLIQDQVDELVLPNDCTISYRHAKGSGIGTHLSGERDWKMFLKEYQKLSLHEREMMIIASLKFKKAKSNQATKR
jgi:hypothetical protein